MRYDGSDLGGRRLVRFTGRRALFVSITTWFTLLVVIILLAEAVFHEAATGNGTVTYPRILAVVLYPTIAASRHSVLRGVAVEFLTASLVAALFTPAAVRVVMRSPMFADREDPYQPRPRPYQPGPRHDGGAASKPRALDEGRPINWPD